MCRQRGHLVRLRCDILEENVDKKIARLLGAVAGLATMSTAQAATHPAPNPSEALQASSYADLLAPIANAAAVLKADDAARAQTPVADALEGVQVVQAYYPYQPYYRHHHHHHHRYYRRRYSHHHHHHNSGFVGVPGVGGVVVGR
jgi:hypothetical protein